MKIQLTTRKYANRVHRVGQMEECADEAKEHNRSWDEGYSVQAPLLVARALATA